MKQIQTGLLAVLAIAALGVVAVASASAETTLLAEWLANGAAITTALATKVTGSILLEDTETLAGAAAVLCTATADGSVGSNGADETTSILNAKGEAVGALGGLALLGTGAASGEGSECVAEKTCASGSSTSPIEVWPVGLPWKTTLFLMENGTFLDLIVGTGGSVGYELLCLVLSVNTEDTCTAADFEVEIVNNGSGNAVIPSGALVSPNASCSQSGGKATGINQADSETPILLESGELLSVSSE